MTTTPETRVVPVEPTEEMYSAGYDATRLESGFPQFADAGFCLGHAGKIYRAMLAAAPAVPAPEPVAYQTLTAGKWVECSEFVAKGWGDTLADGCRALYAVQPAPVAASAVDDPAVDVLWCESCGEAPQEVSLDWAGLCRSCADTEGEPS